MQVILERQLTLAEAAQCLGWSDAQEVGRCLEKGKAAWEVLYQRNLGLVHNFAYTYYQNTDKGVPYCDIIHVRFLRHQEYTFAMSTARTPAK